jgi:hypothetical protein
MREDVYFGIHNVESCVATSKQINGATIIGTNVIKVYDVMWVEVRQTMAKAHSEFKMVIPN